MPLGGAHPTLLDRIAVRVEENLSPQPVELGIVVVLSLLLGLRDAECECAQALVVAPDQVAEQHRQLAALTGRGRQVARC